MNIAHAGEDTIMGETLNTMEMTSGPMVLFFLNRCLRAKEI